MLAVLSASVVSAPFLATRGGAHYSGEAVKHEVRDLLNQVRLPLGSWRVWLSSHQGLGPFLEADDEHACVHMRLRRTVLCRLATPLCPIRVKPRC